MNRRRIALALLAVFLPLLAQAQDLASLAKREKERRARVAKPVKVLTEDDGKEATARGAGSVTSLEGGGGGVAPSPELSPTSQAKPDVEAQKAPWKARATGARDVVTNAEKALAKMESDLEEYRSDLTLVSAADALDPMRLQKREARMVQMNKEIAAQRAAVADARRALAAFEQEARRAGVPAGWLR